MTKKRLTSYIVNLAIVIVIFLILQLLISNGIISRYYGRIVNLICINIILAVSLNLSTGFLGQLVLGHAGFMAVGAYFAAMITLNASEAGIGMFPVALIAGGIAAAIVGVIIGIPALRLQGDYLAIITLGFGEIIRVIFNNLPIFGGAKGLNGISSFTSFPWAYILAMLTIFVCYTLINSKNGRLIITIREDEIASTASGVNTTYIKLFAFVLSAFIAGIAGGLYAHQVGVISPDKFDFNYSIEILVMVVLGGMGSVTGSVIAAIVLTILPEALRSVADYRMLAYSAVLVIMMLFKPLGLLGQVELSLAGAGRAIKKRISRKKTQIPPETGEG